MMTDPEQGARTAMGLAMILLAMLGVALVARASDLPMLVFGYALIVFGIAYAFGLVSQHFDAVAQARLEAPTADATRSHHAKAAQGL